MENKITVMYIDKDDMILKEKEITNCYDSLREIIGDTIEMPYLDAKIFDREIDIMCDENAKLKSPTIKDLVAIVCDKKGQVLDIVYNNLIFLATDREEGDSISLTESQKAFLLAYLSGSRAIMEDSKTHEQKLVYVFQAER